MIIMMIYQVTTSDNSCNIKMHTNQQISVPAAFYLFIWKDLLFKAHIDTSGSHVLVQYWEQPESLCNFEINTSKLKLVFSVSHVFEGRDINLSCS